MSEPQRALLASLTEAEMIFLAGVVFARGKFYLGASARGRSKRYSPSVTIEMTEPLPDRLAGLFDGPYERAYYGHPVLRYAIQDTARIEALVTALYLWMPESAQPRMLKLRAFCAAQTSDERDRKYTEFIAVN